MSREASELTRAASLGEVDAFKDLCDNLLSTNLDAQMQSLEAVRAVSATEFWLQVLAFIPTARWKGQSIPEFEQGSFNHQRIALKLNDMLERSPGQGGPSNVQVIDLALKASMESTDPAVRAVAARLAGVRNSTACLSGLKELLSDSNPVVRFAAAEAFGQLAAPDELEPLGEALEDDDAGVRMRAREELTNAGRAAIPVLAEKLRSDEILTRWEAVRALADMEDEQAIGPLTDALHDSDSTVRRTAADGLAHLGTQGAQSVLHTIVHSGSEPNVIHEALHSVRILSEKEELRSVLEPVAAALSGPEPAVTAPIAAQTALKKLNKAPFVNR